MPSLRGCGGGSTPETEKNPLSSFSQVPLGTDNKSPFAGEKCS